METISNLASTATTTVSNLIYGEPAKNNETGGKEPVSGQTGQGTVDEPYDQGNSESALARNTTSTTSTTDKIEPTREVEPTGSIQKPQDLINAYDNASGDSTLATGTGSTGSTGSTATGITDKAGVTDTLWKPTEVDAVKPSVTDPAAASGSGVGHDASTGKPASGSDTLWRDVDVYKDPSSTGPTSTGLSSTGPTSTGLSSTDPTSTGLTSTGPTSTDSTSTGLTSTGATSTGSTLTGSEPTRVTSHESTSGGPKGAIDAEPKNYSIGDLTSGKETPPKSVDNNTSSFANTTSKTGDSAASPPDLSTTSPNSKTDYTADTHQPSHTGGLAAERAGTGGPGSSSSPPATHSSTISPSGDDDEKNGKMSALKDKLKNKLHIGSKDH